MNNISNEIYTKILECLNPFESLKLCNISKSITSEVQRCLYWKKECKKYTNEKSTNYYNLFKFLFKNNCYICYELNLTKYQHNYNICYKCTNKVVHKNIINDSRYVKCNEIKCIKYPYYNLNEFISKYRDYKVGCVIFKMNYKKTKLETELKKVQLPIPTQSQLCKDYITGRTNLDVNHIINIIVKNHYLYNYTAYDAFINIYTNKYKYSYKKAKYLSKKMVLNNFKYPSKWPWITTTHS